MPVPVLCFQGSCSGAAAWCADAPPTVCAVQMAARDTGLGAVEQYMHQGKLLALDLLVRVLSDPHHHWAHARPQVRCPRCIKWFADSSA